MFDVVHPYVPMFLCPMFHVKPRRKTDVKIQSSHYRNCFLGESNMGMLMSKEYFSEATQPTIKLPRPPLCCGQGVQALAWAERLDGYLAAVEESPLNKKAREGQTYQPAGLYPKSVDPTGFEYRESVLICLVRGQRGKAPGQMDKSFL